MALAGDTKARSAGKGMGEICGRLFFQIICTRNYVEPFTVCALAGGWPFESGWES
jgi:hypothetical protein